jgi:hypothetical protein
MTPEQWKALYEAEAEAFLDEYFKESDAKGEPRRLIFPIAKEAGRIADPIAHMSWYIDCLQNGLDEDA